MVLKHYLNLVLNKKVSDNLNYISIRHDRDQPFLVPVPGPLCPSLISIDFIILACNNYQLSWCSIQIPPDLKYYGRGMLKLSYPCNYYNAANALGLNLLNNPDLVHQSDKIAAATAIWYYKETSMNEFAEQGDFAGTTQRLNKSQCSNNVVQMARVRIYHKVRHCLDLPKTLVHLIC